MLVMHWDERTGVEVMGKYPEELEIKEKTLMQIYSQHEFSGEAGFVTLAAGAINLASYYTGPETGVYVILILSAEEDGDVYEEAMVEATRQILTDLDPEVLKTLLPPLFQRLSVYPSLNEEQKLSMIYNSDLKRMVIERIREEVVLGKSEIEIWLKDQYEEGFVDMESLIASLVKNKIIKTASVQGLTSDQVFLTRDLILLRVPPIKLVKDPEGRHLPASLVTDYMTEVRNFFDNYKVSRRITSKSSMRFF